MIFVNPEYKKVIVILIIFLLVLVSYFLYQLNLKFYQKALLLIISFILINSLLTILEITNSLGENLIFWLLVSIFFIYFNLNLGLIFLLAVILKIFSDNNFLKKSLKIPIFSFSQRNYVFLLLFIFLTAEFYFYQYLLSQKEFPLNFQYFRKFTFYLEKILKFFNWEISFDEKTSLIILNLLRKANFPELFLNLIEKNFGQQSLNQSFYLALQKQWQNFNFKKVLLMSILGLAFLIAYPFLKIISIFLSFFSWLIYNLLLKLKFVKINIRQLNKEILEL